MAQYFPHDRVRPEQSDLIAAIEDCIKNKRHLIAHAPTGLGKTAATLAPAIEYAIANKKTVFFLTSKHTQHLIAIDTAQKIRAKHQIPLKGVNIIGKKWMCLQGGVDMLPSGDFSEFCKKLREENQCSFYARLRRLGNTGLTVPGEAAVARLKEQGILHTEQLITDAKGDGLCPYYLAEHLAEESDLIVTDYAYLFNPHIREAFLSKIRKPLEQCIIIVDEAHNLPGRVRDVLTTTLSSIALEKAMKEAEKFKYKELQKALGKMLEVLEAYSRQVEGTREKLIKRDSFFNAVDAIRDYDTLQQELILAGEAIRESQRQSMLASIGRFLERWQEEAQEGYARIFSVELGRREPNLVLSYRCLDPAIVTREVIAGSHSTIMMSGTLNPTDMYRDVLGFPENTEERVYDNPFDENNRLNLIVPETTTKFSQRNDLQYEHIAEVIAGITTQIPGNSIVFFPSYALRDAVYRAFFPKTERTCLLEQPRMGKAEKVELLEKFKTHAKTGAILLGAVSGNFAEGIDLPGDLLKGVIVVGLPLPTPDLETKQLIEYYEQKFGKGKGWEYGYVYPAFTRCLQSAGRCIRTETDRGVIVFLDARYQWPMYARCFPHDLQIRVSSQYREMIEAFFDQ